MAARHRRRVVNPLAVCSLREHTGSRPSWPRRIAACPLIDAIWTILEPRGFQGILVWDPIDGLSSFPEGRPVRLADSSLAKRGRKSEADLAKIFRAVAVPDPEQPPVAMVVDYASRVNTSLRMPEQLFAAAEKAAAASRLVPRADRSTPACFNPIVWFANRANDLPFWFTVDNPRIISIPIPLPSADERRTWARVCYDNIDTATGIPEKRNSRPPWADSPMA